MTDRGKEVKQEWEKQLTQHFQSANANIKELLREYLEAKEAEEREPTSDKNDHKYLYKQIKQDRAVDIVKFLLNEKELMEKVKKFMENRKKY